MPPDEPVGRREFTAVTTQITDRLSKIEKKVDEFKFWLVGTAIAAIGLSWMIVVHLDSKNEAAMSRADARAAAVDAKNQAWIQQSHEQVMALLQRDSVSAQEPPATSQSAGP